MSENDADSVDETKEPQGMSVAEAETFRKQAEEKLKAAVIQLSLKHGFLASSVLRKYWYVDWTIPTIGTDGLDGLYFNPAYIAARSVPEVIGLFAHEALHDLGLHPFRRGQRDVERWAIAADGVVNDIVGQLGLQLPGDGVPAVPDTTPEALYERLEMPQQPQAQGGGGGGQGQGQSQGKSGGGKPPKGKPKPQKHPGGCACSMKTPRGPNGQPLTGAALSAAEADAKLNAATAKELAGRLPGTLPAGLTRMLGLAMEEKVPWEQVVARFVSESSKSENAWKKPNRRFLTRNVVLPSRWTPEVPDFVLACDTSGSMSEDLLRAAGSEMMHAMATCESKGAPELTVVWCDTAVSTQVVSDPKELRPVGGGGTMFSPAFRWINENRPLTKGVVFVTDGYVTDFGPEPEYPVLWILTGANESFRPPFGEVACVL